ncbi:hypothetical protein OH77DRAFT_1522455 [Trametes cingulata]|nr:hypothetical protein OH77DRAFT_1522455 [Trametes cingulata]
MNSSNFQYPGGLPSNGDFGGLLNALLSAMQSQHQPQVQTQPGATTGTQSHWGFPPAQVQTGAPMQWNGQYWQQPQTGAVSGIQQSQVVTPWHTNQPAVAQPSAPDLQGMLASMSMLQTFLQRQQQQEVAPQQPPPTQPPAVPTAPVGSVLNDEALLVEALKSCKTGRITPRQAIERLEGVNNHSASAWKDYLLDHLDRLYSLAKPRHDFPSQEKGVPLQNVGKRSLYLGVASIPQRTRVSVLESALVTLSSISSSTVVSGTRRTRGEPVADFHAGTRIPPTTGRRKPKPPLSTDVSNDGRKFTDAEHIFFIHYLRWRLLEDPMIAKRDLYAELAEEMPRRDAAAWKRHWDNYPQLPDQIYNASAQRIPPSDSGEVRRPTSTARTARPPSTERIVSDVQSPPAESEDDICPESEEEEDREDRSTSLSVVPPVRREATRGTKVKVTKEDIQAMARHMLENAANWASRRTAPSRWKDFAEKPENTKRTLLAWTHIESRRAQAIQYYYKKFAAEQRAASVKAREAEPPSNEVTRRDALPGSSSITEVHLKTSRTPELNNAREVKPPTREKSGLSVHDKSFGPEIEISRKRGADELAGKAESPAHKRPKETPDAHEVIVLSD